MRELLAPRTWFSPFNSDFSPRLIARPFAVLEAFLADQHRGGPARLCGCEDVCFGHAFHIGTQCDVCSAMTGTTPELAIRK